jgi:hypothetical protein
MQQCATGVVLLAYRYLRPRERQEGLSAKLVLLCKIGNIDLCAGFEGQNELAHAGALLPLSRQFYRLRNV